MVDADIYKVTAGVATSLDKQNRRKRILRRAYRYYKVLIELFTLTTSLTRRVNEKAACSYSGSEQRESPAD